MRAALVALLGVCALYADAILGRAVFFERDILNYWRPHVEWMVRTLAQGASIGWNPELGFGTPLLADPSLQIFYPFTWLLAILPPDAFYAALVVSHAVLAGAGVGRFAGTDRAHEGGAAAAAALVAAGPFVSEANLWHHYCGAAWIPWVLAETGRLARAGGSWRPAAAALSAQALAGSAESLVLSVLGVAITSGPEAWSRRRDLARAFVTAALVGSVQWAPAASILLESGRMGFTPQMKLSWSLGVDSLSEMLIPHQWDPQSPIAREPRLISSVYMGAATLPFALAGARDAPRLAAGLGGTLAIALGSFWGVLAESAATAVPFRYPSKALALFAVFWAAAVGRGVARAARREVRSTVPAWPAALCSAGVLALPFDEAGAFLGRSLLAFSAAALIAFRGGASVAVWAPVLIAVDLWPHAARVNTLAPPETTKYAPSFTAELFRTADHPRVFVAHPGEAAIATKLGARLNPVDFALALQDAFTPPMNMRFGVAAALHADFTGLGSADAARALRRFPAIVTSRLPRILDVGAVTHIVSSFGLRAPPPDTPAFQSAFGPPIRIETWARVPRFGVPSRAISVGDIDQALDAILSDGFRPGRDVAIHRPHGADEELGAGTILVRTDEPARIVLEARMENPGYVVVRDSWRRGWTARLNGVPTEIEKADGLFRAVRVPAGASEISFEFETPGLRLGTVLAALGIACLGASRFRIR